MFNIQLFKPRGQDLKQRVLKNKEALLDVMAQNIQGARQCPLLLGQKCIGQMCEFFQEFKSLDHATGQATPYWRCSQTQITYLLIEQNQVLRNILNELLLKKEI